MIDAGKSDIICINNDSKRTLEVFIHSKGLPYVPPPDDYNGTAAFTAKLKELGVLPVRPVMGVRTEPRDADDVRYTMLKGLEAQLNMAIRADCLEIDAYLAHIKVALP